MRESACGQRKVALVVASTTQVVTFTQHQHYPAVILACLQAWY